MNESMWKRSENAKTPFCCSYTFDGGKWGLTVYASTLEEAEMKLRAIGETGTVDGVLKDTFPADNDDLGKSDMA